MLVALEVKPWFGKLFKMQQNPEKELFGCARAAVCATGMNTHCQIS
jgi:hypothetical protein